MAKRGLFRARHELFRSREPRSEPACSRLQPTFPSRLSMKQENRNCIPGYFPGCSWWALLVGNTIAFASAMTYDRIVNAIGPFELTEYLGLAIVWGALAVTVPFRPPGRPFDRRADTSRRSNRPYWNYQHEATAGDVR